MWSSPPLAYIGIGTVTVALATLIWNIARNRIVLIINFYGTTRTSDFFPTPWKLAGKMYRMPGSFIQSPRDMILNHRVFTEGMLQPGQVLEGMLMACGPVPVPEESFPHGSETEMNLLVYDQRGKSHKTLFTFFVASGPPENPRLIG